VLTPAQKLALQKGWQPTKREKGDGITVKLGDGQFHGDFSFPTHKDVKAKNESVSTITHTTSKESLSALPFSSRTTPSLSKKTPSLKLISTMLLPKSSKNKVPAAPEISVNSTSASTGNEDWKRWMESQRKLQELRKN